MPRRADAGIGFVQAVGGWQNAGTRYLIQKSDRVFYSVQVDASSDVSFRKSSDGGLTWTAPVVVFAGTATYLSVWYDRWSNVAGDLIHCAYTESGTHDTLYRTINTASSDALSTQTVIFAGASQVASVGHLSIVRAVGGNVYCKTVIDAGAEGGFYRLPNANVPSGAWDAARTVDETIATLDHMILQPDFDAADTQDIMGIFWDASADEISRKLYDDSANSWSETSIATSMAELTATTGGPNFCAIPDPTNTQSILAAWSATDAANADLRIWTVDSGTISEKTNVVLNSVDDQGLVALSIDMRTGWWWVFYCGASGGGETWNTALRMYCKVSQDGGTTWGAETKVGPADNVARTIRGIWAAPWAYTPPALLWVEDGTTEDLLKINVDHTLPRATYQIGV